MLEVNGKLFKIPTMQQIIVCHQKSDLQESLDNFLDLYYSSRMKYFASDLLQEGLSPYDISKAIDKAMTAAQAGGVEVRRHFTPMYTQTESGLLKDCKLSRLSYALVLLNADGQIPIVARWQLRLVSEFLKQS